MLNLSDSDLLIERAFIGGEWQDAADGATIAVDNPATGAALGRAPRMGAAETRRAIAAAADAFLEWRRKTAKERGAILLRWRALILQNSEDLARLMTAEQGKPLAEARGEVAYGASFMEWFAEEGKRAYGEIVPPHKQGAEVRVTREPIGVAALITPWNFPIAMIARKAAPALAAGCAVVIKPAELTPFCAFALARLGERAGLPAGTLNVVTGDAAAIGREMCENPAVRALSFTGSTKVGKLLAAQCAGSLKKLSLELGGNAPFIVFDDADLELAAAQLMLCKFRNSGQTCVCANRIYVQDGVYDSFVGRLKEKVAALKVGDGAEDGVTQGPLINRAALEKVARQVADAKAKGAAVVCGGEEAASDAGGAFYAPTILADVGDDALCAREETFGPVAPLFRFADEAEVIRRANDCAQGLAAFFCTRDLGRAMRVSAALEAGIVGVNEGIISTEIAPFGGVKESGFGREGSRHGLDEYMEIKYTLFGYPAA